MDKNWIRIRNMLRAFILSLLVLTVAGCSPGGLPSESEVVAEFKKQHPTATVIGAAVGEGDSDHAYWKIKFKDSPDAAVREIEWGVRSTDGSEWEVFHRGNGE